VHSSKVIAASVALWLAGAAPVGAAPVCEPAGRTTAVIALSPPAGVGLAGVKLRLDYPAEQVAIPGRGDDADVKGRVSGTPSGVLAQPNDEESHLIVALVSTATLPQGPVITVDFDACRGAEPATVARFTCTVEQASNEEGQLVDGARCTVTLRDAQEGERS
jgi:hypothetical protein